MRVNIISNAFLCSVYMIRIERNNRIFNKELKPEEVVIKSVIQMVRDRTLSLKNIPRSNGVKWFLDKWSLPETILKPIASEMGGLLSDVSSLNVGREMVSLYEGFMYLSFFSFAGMFGCPKWIYLSLRVE